MILVTGGAGVMGSRLVRALCEKGERVRVLTLPNDPNVLRLTGLDCELAYGDVSDPLSLAGICENVTTVFHLAGIIISPNPETFDRVNVDGTRNLVDQCLKSKVKHFIFVSSISVVYPVSTPYAASKKACELILKSQDKLNWTIVRPTLTYDEVGGQEFWMLVEGLLRYPIAFLVGRGEAIKNPVWAGDLIQGFLTLPTNDKAYNKIYNFCGGREITVRELAQLILKLRGAEKPIVPVPLPVCKFIAAATEPFMQAPPLTSNGIVGLTQNANPDWGEAQRDLGYNPIDVREGLRRFLKES